MNLVQQVYAQGQVSNRVNAFEIPGINSIADILGIVTNVILGIGIALVIIFLIIGGIQYVTARGDVKAAEAARNSLTNAVIGFIVIIGAFTIRLIAANVIGQDANTGEVDNVTPF